MIRKASGVATVLRRKLEDWPILEIAWSRGSGLRLKLDPRRGYPASQTCLTLLTGLAKLILPGARGLQASRSSEPSEKIVAKKIRDPRA